MVRETRYLLVRNLPEKSTEESVNLYFQRYGKIQSVKLQPAKDNESTITATVAFMDIKSASKAHSSKNIIDNAVLRTDYWEATSSSSTRTQGDTNRTPGGTNSGGGVGGGGGSSGSGVFHHGSGLTSAVNRSGSGSSGPYAGSWTGGSGSYHRHGTERSGEAAARTQAETGEKDRFERSRSSPELSGSTRNKKSISMSRSASRSRSRSPRSRSGSSSSRSYSSESSKSCSKSQSHESSQGSTRPQSTIGVLKSMVASEIKDPKADKARDSDDGSDRRPLGICITGLPTRSSDSSLRDGLFHEYKKHGKVTSVQIINENGNRFAVVSFRKPEDASKALEASQGKMFFGTKIKVMSHEGVKVEDGDIRTNEMDMDEYHPKATRTLFVGNLEKDTAVQDLTDKFSDFGEIIDVDIKKQGAASAYAFVQYTDIVSVVKALHEMEGEHIGANKIKLGFGKSMPTNCVWVDNIAESLNEKFLSRVFKRYGEITYLFLDRNKYRALIFYTNLDDSQYAVVHMRNRTLGKKKIMIDFASRECQTNFLDKMEKNGQLRSSDRPDERGLHKFRQRSFEFQEFTDENRPRFPSTVSQNSGFFRNRTGRGRGRNFEDGTFQEDFSPARRASRQSSDFGQPGSYYKSVDDYEQELREYGHSQRERRERGHSPRRDGEDSQSFEDRSLRSSREVSLDRYDNKDRQLEMYSRQCSPSPGSEHNSFRSERFVSRTVEDKVYRDKYKEKSEEKVSDRLNEDVDVDFRGRRSPIYVSDRRSSTPVMDDDLGSMTPPTPTQEEEPIYRTFYPRGKDSDSDFTPTYTVMESKPKLKSVWVSQAVTATSSSATKLGSEVTLLEKSSVRKRVHEESLSKDTSSKKKFDRVESVGSLTLKVTPTERERQQKPERKQHRKMTSSKGLDKLDKSGTSKTHLKSLEGVLSSPSSSGSRPDSENGSVSEADLLILHRKKQLLLEKLNKLKQQEDYVVNSDGNIDENVELGNISKQLDSLQSGSLFSPSVRSVIDQDDAACMEELMKTIDSKQSCRKQMEQIAKMESRLKERQREKLLALQAADGSRTAGSEKEFKVSVGVDSNLLDNSGNNPSESKRRKLDLREPIDDLSANVIKHSYRKDNGGGGTDETRSQLKDSYSVLEVPSDSVTTLLDKRNTLESNENAVLSMQTKDLSVKNLRNFVDSSTNVGDTSIRDRHFAGVGFNISCKQSFGNDKVVKGTSKTFLSSTSEVLSQEKTSWSPKFGPSPEASFSPALSEEHPDIESNNSESLTEKSSPKPLSPLSDWPQHAPLSLESKDLSDNDSDRLGLKSTEPGLLSLAHVDDSLSDSSEEENIKLGEPSVEERIRMVDEIMQLATLNKTTDMSLLPSSTVGSSTPLSSSNSLVSSLYSKYKIRRRGDSQTVGQSSLVPERKSEPSVIMQQLLSKPSILDQDFERLGQRGEKFEPSLTLTDLNCRLNLPLHTKAALKEMPSLHSSGQNISQPTPSEYSFGIPVTLMNPLTTTASFHQSASTATSFTGQQTLTVTNSAAPAVLPVGLSQSSASLSTSVGSPRFTNLSHLVTPVAYSLRGGSRSPCTVVGALPLSVSFSSQPFSFPEHPVLVGGNGTNVFDKSHTPISSPAQIDQENISFCTAHETGSPKGSLATANNISVSNSLCFDSKMFATPIDLVQTVRADTVGGGNRSPRVSEPVSVSISSPVVTITTSMSPFSKKDSPSSSHLGITLTAKHICGPGKNTEAAQILETVKDTSASSIDLKKMETESSLVTKCAETDSMGRHRDGAFQVMEELEMISKLHTDTAAVQSPLSSTEVCVPLGTMSSQSVTNSVPASVICVTSGTPQPTITSTITTLLTSTPTSSTRTRSENDKPNKSSKSSSHSKSLDQSVKHDPLFTPDIKPDPVPAKVIDTKTHLTKEKNSEKDCDKSSHADSCSKADMEIKEKKSHSRSASSTDKKVSKSSRDASVEKNERKDHERKQDHYISQKTSEKMRHESGSKNKKEGDKMKEHNSHIRSKESDAHSKSKESETAVKVKDSTSDVHGKNKDGGGETSVKNKDIDVHGKSKDKKMDSSFKVKEIENESHGKIKGDDVKNKENETVIKNKTLTLLGKNIDKDAEQVKSNEKDGDSHQAKSKPKEDNKKESRDHSIESEIKNKSKDHNIDIDARNKSNKHHESHKKDRDKKSAVEKKDEKKPAEKIEAAKEVKKNRIKSEEKKDKKDDKKAVETHEKDKERTKQSDKHDNVKQETKSEKVKDHHEAKKEKNTMKVSDKPLADSKEHKPKEDQKQINTSVKNSVKPAKEVKDSKSNKSKETDKNLKISSKDKCKAKDKEEKLKEKVRQKKEKEKEKKKEKDKKKKEPDISDKSSKVDEIDDFPYHLIEEPVFTSMYDTIKRRSCNKEKQVKEVSDDTRQKLTQLKTSRSSNKKSKSSRSILDDSSSDDSEPENLLSLESDSQNSDSGSPVEKKVKQSQKKSVKQPLQKKKRTFVLSSSSSSDDDVEEDEEALLSISKAKMKSSQEKKFRQIFDSSTDSDEDLDKDSSPERLPERTNTNAPLRIPDKNKTGFKLQEKAKPPKKQIKKRKLTEDSNDDSDITDIPRDNKPASHLPVVSEVSMTEDTMDEIEKLSNTSPLKTKKKKKNEEKLPVKQKKVEGPLKKPKLSKSKEKRADAQEIVPEKKESLPDKKENITDKKELIDKKENVIEKQENVQEKKENMTDKKDTFFEKKSTVIPKEDKKALADLEVGKKDSSAESDKDISLILERNVEVVSKKVQMKDEALTVQRKDEVPKTKKNKAKDGLTKETSAGTCAKAEKDKVALKKNKKKKNENIKEGGESLVSSGTNDESELKDAKPAHIKQKLCAKPLFSTKDLDVNEETKKDETIPKVGKLHKENKLLQKHVDEKPQISSEKLEKESGKISDSAKIKAYTSLEDKSSQKLPLANDPVSKGEEKMDAIVAKGKEREKKDKKLKAKVYQEKNEKLVSAVFTSAKENHREPILQMLAEDMEREEQKVKVKIENNMQIDESKDSFDDIGKTNVKKKKRKTKEILEASLQSFAIKSLVAESDLSKEPESELQTQEPEEEPEDPFVSFWGHPAPVLPKKRDSIPKLDDQKEKEKDEKKHGKTDLSTGEEATESRLIDGSRSSESGKDLTSAPIDNAFVPKDNEAVPKDNVFVPKDTISLSKDNAVHKELLSSLDIKPKPAWDMSIFLEPVKSASNTTILDQETKLLIDIPESLKQDPESGEAPSLENISLEKSKGDKCTKKKPKKKKEKSDRKSSKEIDPLAAVESSLEASSAALKDHTVLLQDVIDNKAVFPDRRFSFEDEISIAKDSSPLFSEARRELRDMRSPPVSSHLSLDSRPSVDKNQDSKFLEDVIKKGPSELNTRDASVKHKFENKELITKVSTSSDIDSTEKAASTIPESILTTKISEDKDSSLVPQLERDEIAMQEASDEAARAVECLLGVQEDTNQYGFESGSNLPASGLSTDGTCVISTSTTSSSPSSAVNYDSISLQSQPGTTESDIHEASEITEKSSQPVVDEEFHSILKHKQLNESEPEFLPEITKKTQQKGKRLNRSKVPKDASLKEEINLQEQEQQDVPHLGSKSLYPSQTIPFTVFSDAPIASEVTKVDLPEIKKNPIDAYDFDSQMNEDDTDLLIEPSLGNLHNLTTEDQALVIKSPRRRTTTSRGRGRRGRGGSVRETLDKVCKSEQMGPSQVMDQSNIVSIPAVAPVTVIPPWQQAIVKEDLASPESKTDLDSSYGEAELVINLDDQGTPNNSEDCTNKSQYHFGSDTDEKSPAHQSAALASPYKAQRSTRTRKPTNYKAMDQGLGMNIPSPRASRSGSSPRGARGGQSPKNSSTPRGRGSPKTSDFGSPVVKLEKLEMGRGKKKDDLTQKGRVVGKDSEGIDDIAHTSFEDWKASNLLSTIDTKPISRENIYEFEDSEQEQKLEPSPILRATRGRSKRASESSEGSLQVGKPSEPVSAGTQLGPPTSLPQVQVMKDLQEEQAQASDDSSSSMSNVDKIIDAVSKGFFDCADSKSADVDATIISRTGLHGKSGADTSLVSISPDAKIDPDILIRTRISRRKHDMHPVMAVAADISSSYSQGFPEGGQSLSGRSSQLIKLELHHASANQSKMPQINVDLPQSHHGSPSFVTGDIINRTKKVDTLFSSLDQAQGPAQASVSNQHQLAPLSNRVGSSFEDRSTLGHTSFMSGAAQPGLADQIPHGGVFAFPPSRELSAGPCTVSVSTPSRVISQDSRYSSPKLSAQVTVITSAVQQTVAVTTTSSMTVDKHVPHNVTSASMPPVPALVQTYAQAGPKISHGISKNWLSGPANSGQQIQTPPSPSSQVSPTSSLPPQRPQSVQLPVLAHSDLNPSPMALKRPPSAHSNQSPSLSTNSRDRPACPTSHQGDMRPPSLPSELLPPELTTKTSLGLERREREHFLPGHLVGLHQRQGFAAPPGFVMVPSEHGPMAIHGMPPPSSHSQIEPTKLVSSTGATNSSPSGGITVSVGSPSSNHLHGRRGSLQDSVSAKVPSTATGGTYAGVVVGPPHSLSPKTTSPVGQVIERLPNPMRPLEPVPGTVGGPSHAHRTSGSSLHQDTPLHARFHKEEASLRGMQPPVAHGESRSSHDLMMMQQLIEQQQQQQQQHQQHYQHLIMAQQYNAAAHAAARNAALTRDFTSRTVTPGLVRSTNVTQDAPVRSVSAQEATRNATTVPEVARSAVGKDVRKETSWNVAPAHEAPVSRNSGVIERAIQDHKGGSLSHTHNQMLGLGIAVTVASMQQVPLNLADSDSRSGPPDSRGAGNSSGNKPSQLPFAQLPGSYLDRGKTGERPPTDSGRLSNSAFVSPSGGRPPSAHRESLGSQLYGSELGVFQSPHFSMTVGRIPLDPRSIYGSQQHPHSQFLSREGVLSSPFPQFISGQRFSLEQHPDSERLLKKDHSPAGPIPSGLLPLGRSPSPIPSPSPRGLPPEMMGHAMLRIAEIPVRENLHSVLGRYAMVWQGMLALKNDHSFVQMHFVSGSRDLPDQALPQPLISGAALPLRISQRMRLETPNLEGVTKRMINEKDYSLLLAVPCGHDHMDISEQTKNLTIGFIEYLRSKQAAGIVNVSHPGSQQPAFVVHVFPPCEFSMEVVARHSTGLIEQIHDLAHVIIIITTV